MTALEAELRRLRARTGIKWATAAPGTLPAWVAEMDFAPPPAVVDALRRYVGGADFGYPVWADDGVLPLREAYAERMARRCGWSPSPGHMRAFTDLNQAFQAVIDVATRPGDAIAVHAPGYPAFLRALPAMGRRPVPLALTADGDSWSADPSALAAEPDLRALVLVNPHNPTGHAFAAAELDALARLAEERDLLVIADEAHADLVYEPRRHLPFAAISPETEARTVTLASAGKAFNLGGLRCAVAHLGPAHVRERLAQYPPALLGELGVPGVVATVAAWRECDAWLRDLLGRLDANRRALPALRAHGLGYRPPEAGYLAWLDCRPLGTADPAAFFRDRAGVDLIDGARFGPQGEGFVRLNFATSAVVLQEMITRLARACEEAA
jgi:cystathionine beta-lyase